MAQLTHPAAADTGRPVSELQAVLCRPLTPGTTEAWLHDVLPSLESLGCLLRGEAALTRALRVRHAQLLDEARRLAAVPAPAATLDVVSGAEWLRGDILTWLRLLVGLP